MAPAGRWYFGWNIVAASSILTMLTLGLRMGIGPFFLPITEDLGFSRSLLAGIVAIGMLVYGVGMPIAGQLVSTRGTRFVMLLGVLCVVIALGWAVTATGPIGFLLSFGILLSLGLSFISPVTFTPLIARWFTRQRGAALFFLSTGSMAGIALLTPGLGILIQALGWRVTLIAYGILLTVLTIPVAVWVMREDAPEGTDTRPDAPGTTTRTTPAPASTALRVSDAVHSVPFWQVVLGLFACGYSMNLLGIHGVPMLVDHGYSEMTAAFGIGLIGFSAIFSTMVLGRLSDMMPRRNLLAIIYFVRGLGFFGLLIVGSTLELYSVAVIGGIVWAGSVALSSAILADIYGVRLVGVLYGWAYLGHQIGGMISAWLGGWAYEHFGTHWIAFGSTGVLLFVAALVSFRLPLPGTYRLQPRSVSPTA